MSNARGLSFISVTDNHFRTVKKVITEENSSLGTYNVFITFCEESSLHGLKYVGKRKNHYAIRIFWAIAFLAAVGIATYFIHAVYKKWRENPVIVSITSQPTDITTLPFPALTICHGISDGLLTKEIVDSFRQQPNWHLYEKLVEEYCDENTTMIPPTATDPEMLEAFKIFKRLVTADCSNMIYFVEFNKKILDTFKDYLYSTPLCCTFNAVKPEFMFKNLTGKSFLNSTTNIPAIDWNLDSGYAHTEDPNVIPLRTSGAGYMKALDILVSTGDLYCELPMSDLFLVSVHNPTEVPDFDRQSLGIKLGRGYNYNVKPLYIDAAESLRSLSPHIRKCYFSGEKPLQFFRTYTKFNCEQDCVASMSFNACGCIPFELAEMLGKATCEQQNECYLKIATENNFSANTGTVCDCLQGCKELTYTVFENSQPLEPLTSLELLEILGEEKQMNFSGVAVYFTESKYMSYYRSELLGFNEFLANTGGLLGLFLGFSFLSVVEVFYFIYLGIAKIFTRRRKVHPQTKSWRFWQDSV